MQINVHLLDTFLFISFRFISLEQNSQTERKTNQLAFHVQIHNLAILDIKSTSWLVGWLTGMVWLGIEVTRIGNNYTANTTWKKS